ncbi:MAG: J domain-containing protein [Oscillospiraceae bacterium]|nr:J domain-containing protein [Oscillospiraceae bacterium]
MTDPYKILGISESATDDQVKTAYRDLARKYHPDNYEGGPLAKVANEKTQEINNAYDTIMNARRGSGYNSASGSYDTDGKPNHDHSPLSDIRALINDNRIVEAEELLDGVPPHLRKGEWYFLKGTIFFSRGWLEDASSYWTTATEMEPGNAEYRAALNRVMWQKRGNFGGSSHGQYNNPQTRQNSSGCGICDICAGLMCADCCCHCMGGRGCC